MMQGRINSKNPFYLYKSLNQKLDIHEYDEEEINKDEENPFLVGLFFALSFFTRHSSIPGSGENNGGSQYHERHFSDRSVV